MWKFIYRSLSLHPPSLTLNLTRSRHTGCSLNIVFFPRIPEIWSSLPRQHSAAIGCTKMTSQLEWLYTRIALRALKVSYSDVGEGGVAVNCEKTQFFLNTL